MNAQDKAESLRLIELIEPETCAMTDDGSGDFIFCIDALRNIIELQDGEDMAARGAAQKRTQLKPLGFIAVMLNADDSAWCLSTPTKRANAGAAAKDWNKNARVPRAEVWAVFGRPAQQGD